MHNATRRDEDIIRNWNNIVYCVLTYYHEGLRGIIKITDIIRIWFWHMPFGFFYSHKFSVYSRIFLVLFTWPFQRYPYTWDIYVEVDFSLVTIHFRSINACSITTFIQYTIIFTKFHYIINIVIIYSIFQNFVFIKWKWNLFATQHLKKKLYITLNF